MDKQETLAMEMLQELKRSARRNFILAVILLIALVGSNVAWLVYESQYEEADYEVQEQTVEDAESSNINQVIGE